MSKHADTERTEAQTRLREWLKPGDTVYTVLRHVSRSGMSRSISVIIQGEHGPFDASGMVARACGFTFDRRYDGIKVSGCGMDMGFHLVYSLSRTLWPTGYGCTGEHCNSNDHTNGDRDYTPHGTCSLCREVTCQQDKPHPQVQHWHRDGGYALRHRWL